jgi:hypothetical protein
MREYVRQTRVLDPSEFRLVERPEQAWQAA